MSDDKMRALIFGSNGFVGEYLARELEDNGYEVFGSDKADASRIELSDYWPCDVLDSERVEEVVRACKPHVIVNLAAISSVGQSWSMPQLTMEINVVGALNIMEAARKQDPMPKVMLIGSSEEYAPSDEPLSEESEIDANNPYGISKIAQEQFAKSYAQRYGLQVYLVRAFNHTGVGQQDTFVLPSFCKQTAEIDASGKPGVIKVGNLEVVRDFSDVRDIVRAYRMILESDYAGEVFNVGSGVGYSLRDLLEIIVGFSDQPIEVVADPVRFRPTDNPIIVCDRSKAKEKIGWTPQLQLRDTLHEMFLAH